MSKYKGIESSEVYSLGWNVVMVQFKCCGVDSYKDFDFTGEWVQPVVGVTLETPIACCKTLPTGATLADFACATSYDETLSNGMTGCYSEIWSRSFGKTAVVVPVLVVCGLIQIAFIVFAISLAKSVDEEKVRPL
ncbi:tetraspanin-18-like [Dreissena polymorpha]|uniref:tetraspanin-18-like n=1 Tax=Dreissena polymorpha TaxID=45954 RepID=UPI002264BD6D|nr:tetraspanin-18-like [Dreissena polymorpha]